MRLRIAFAAPVLILAAATHLTAQTIVGEVLEATSLRPLRGAFVRLLDGRGAPVASILSDSLGSYALRAPASGTYRVTAELLGFAPFAQDSVSLEPGRAQRLTLELEPEAVRLDRITATAKTQCSIRPESGAATQELWQQVRRALDVAVWSTQSNQLRYVIATFRRTLDRRGKVSSRLRPDSALGTGTRPFDTPSADDLTGRGFIQPGKLDDEFTYYAPDAEVLVSDGFLSTHCFWVTPSPKQHDDWIGLGFEPVPTRTISDISGVLWVDRRTGELQLLEYDYTRLPWELPDGQAGGRVAFRRTPAGAWIIQSWSIRIPKVQAAPPTVGRYAPRNKYQLVGYEEAGGDVRDLRTLEGLRIPGVHTAAALGTVFDSTNHAPLAGARVLVEGSALEARTDLNGRYELEEIPAGEHELVVEHPRLATLGVQLGAKAVRFTGGAWVRRDFAVPSLPTVLAGRCTAGQPILAGYVRDTVAGGTVRGARIAVSWQADGRTMRTVTSSDATGAYVLCGVPQNSDITLEASGQSSDQRGTARARLGARSALQADIGLGSGSRRDTPPDSAIRLAPIQVNAEARALPKFEAVRQRQLEMQKVGLGQFLWRKEFEKRSPNRLTDVLRGMRGIEIVPFGTEFRPGQYIVRTTRSTGRVGGRNPCLVQLYIDGMRVTGTTGSPMVLDDLAPIAAIEAIEVYVSPAEVPPEFGGSSFGCGVIVVWTRAAPDR